MPSSAGCSSPPGSSPRACTGTALWYRAGIAPVPSAADASWHIDALRASIRWVLVRDPSGEHEPAAFLSTDLDAQPATIPRDKPGGRLSAGSSHVGAWRPRSRKCEPISAWRAQRQWSDLAILRTTPALLGLFSLITVWADGLARDAANALRPNVTAWYAKLEPTFSDAIAAVRRVLWAPPNLSMSRQPGETITIAAGLLNRVFQTRCLAA